MRKCRLVWYIQFLIYLLVLLHFIILFHFDDLRYSLYLYTRISFIFLLSLFCFID
jgi:predicted ferric reductase